MAIFFSLLFAGIALFILLVLTISRLHIRNPFKQKLGDPSHEGTETIADEPEPVQLKVKDSSDSEFAFVDYFEASSKQVNSSKANHEPVIELSHEKDDLELEDEPRVDLSKIDEIEEESEVSETEEPVTTDPSPQFIVLYIMAKADHHFHGYELLQVLFSYGLRYGDMKIFHYFDPFNPKRKVFSLASATEPGYFDIDQIGALSCMGLCLFMQLNKTNDDYKRLDILIDVATKIADDLGGRLCDERRTPFNINTRERLIRLIQLAGQPLKEEEVV